MRKTVVLTIATLALLLAGAIPAAAQGYRYADTVTSASGTAVVGAAISVYNTAGIGTYTISGISEAGNVVTVTTSSAHGLSRGDTVAVFNVSVSSYDGIFIVDTVPSATTFTYGVTPAGLASSSSGTVATSAALSFLYSDAGLGKVLSNPTHSDGYGNFSFYAAPGTYALGISGSHIATSSVTIVVLPCVPGSACDALSVTTLKVGSTTLSSGATAARAVLFPDSAGTVPLFSGAPTASDCVKWGSNGQLDDAGAACGTGSGGASLSAANTWTATQSFQPASGDAIDILNSSAANIGKWDSSGNITVENGLSNLGGTFNITSCSGCNMVLTPGSGGSVTIAGTYGVTTGRAYFTSGGSYGEMIPTTLSTNRTYTLPDASGTVCVAGAGTSGCGGISETTFSQTNLAPGSSTGSGTTYTAFTAPSAGLYRFVGYLNTTLGEVSCSTNASVYLQVSWTDSESGSSETVSGANVVPGTAGIGADKQVNILMNLGSGATVTAAVYTATVPSGCNTNAKLAIHGETLP